MAGIIAERSFSTREFEWYMSDMRTLLDVNSSPQEVADNALTIAQNVYGRFEGGVEMRKGIAAHGAAFAGAPAHVDGLFELAQQVINGVPQNPAVVTRLAQCGGNLYNEVTKAQIGANNVLGVNALPWSAQYVLDADHTLPTPGAPTNNAPVAGGALAAGTYLVSVTWKNALGQTVNGPDVAIVITINQQVVINQPVPPIGATTWQVYASTANGARGTETLQSADIPIATTTFNFSNLLAGTAPPATNTAIAPCDVVIIATGSGGPYVYDGSQVYVPAAWAANCSGARWVQVVNNVVFFGGLPSQPNLVAGMLLGHAETFAGANTFSTSHPVMGLGVVGTGAQASLAIGMTSGLTLLNGTGINTFEEAEVPMEDGVTGGRTMVTAVDPLTGLSMLLFVGGSDIYIVTTTNIIPIGLNVRPYILNDALAINPWDIPMNGDRTKSHAFYYNNRIYVFYDSGNVGHPNVGLVWDLYLRGWTTYVGSPINCAMTLNAPGDANPPQVVVGSATAAQTYNFDVYNGTAQNADDAGTAINAIALTKYFKLGVPGSPKKVRRIYPEIFAEQGFNGNIVVDTDYGASSGGSILVGPPGTGMLWDVNNWDVSNWFGGGLINYISPPNNRIDLNLPGDAFAFGVSTNSVQAPWRWQAVKAIFIQNPTR